MQPGKKFILFLLVLVVYYAASLIVYPGLRIQLGTVNVPTPELVSLWNWWQAWSWLIIATLAIAILSIENLDRTLAKVTSVRAIFLVSLTLSLVVRFYVMNSMYLTDDESAYLFAARSISSGRLFVDSPENSIFFDRVFMINDGQFFPQYFYGWPLLLAAGFILKVPFLVNSLFFAGSCVLVYKVLNRLTDSYWGLVGVVLFALAPLSLVNSASYLTHSSATFFTLILANAYHSLSGPNNSSSFSSSMSWQLATASAAAGILFNIRPMTGVLISLPYFVATVIILAKQKTMLKYSMALFVPGLLLLIIFFALNYFLHGSPLTSGYGHYINYAIENNFRFSWWNLSGQSLTAADVPFFPLFDGRSFVMSIYAGWMRLIHDGLGFPVVIIPTVAIAWALRYHIAMASAVVLMVVGYARWYDGGVDSFGPVHLSEAQPLIGILLILFTHSILSWWHDNMRNKAETVSKVFRAAGLATVVSIFLAYSLFRFFHVAVIARSIAIPYNEVEHLKINNAVVFSPLPFIDQRSIAPIRHFRYWRDNPLPDMSDNIIWVNDLGPTENRVLLNMMPDRKGYRMTWLDGGRGVSLEEVQP